MESPSYAMLVTAAISAGAGFIFKHVFDRFTESHKVEVALSAKRRERYYDKQAAVVAGMYERLAKLVHFVNTMSTHPSRDAIDTKDVLTLFTESLQYFEVNELYFPQAEAATIKAVIAKLRYPVVAVHNYNVIDKVPPDLSGDLSTIRESVRTIMEQLQDKFRTLMMGQDSHPPKTLWQRLQGRLRGTRTTSHPAM
jgi:hypothetical protein